MYSAQIRSARTFLQKQIPSSQSRVTEEMSLVMALVQQVNTADTSNETLAYYIEQTDVSAALAGEVTTPFLPHVFRPNSFFTDFPPKANS
jgi:hypothetical protein